MVSMFLEKYQPLFLLAIRYIIVGFVNTALGLSFIFFGIIFFDFNEITANIFGYTIGFLLSYILHRSWTFRNSSRLGKSLPRFAFVVAFAYTCNITTVLAMYRLEGMDIYLSQVAGVFVYTVVSFIGNHYFTFSTNFD